MVRNSYWLIKKKCWEPGKSQKSNEKREYLAPNPKGEWGYKELQQYFSIVELNRWPNTSCEKRKRWPKNGLKYMYGTN